LIGVVLILGFISFHRRRRRCCCFFFFLHCIVYFYRLELILRKGIDTSSSKKGASKSKSGGKSAGYQPGPTHGNRIDVPSFSFFILYYYYCYLIMMTLLLSSHIQVKRVTTTRVALGALASPLTAIIMPRTDPKPAVATVLAHNNSREVPTTTPTTTITTTTTGTRRVMCRVDRVPVPIEAHGRLLMRCKLWFEIVK
jgi:hypothetical protein